MATCFFFVLLFLADASFCRLLHDFSFDRMSRTDASERRVRPHIRLLFGTRANARRQLSAAIANAVARAHISRVNGAFSYAPARIHDSNRQHTN